MIKYITVAILALALTGCSGEDGSNGQDGTNVELNQTITVDTSGMTTDNYYDLNSTMISVNDTMLSGDGGSVPISVLTLNNGDADNFVVGWTDDYYGDIYRDYCFVTEASTKGNFIEVECEIYIPRNNEERMISHWFRVMYFTESEPIILGETQINQDIWIDPDELQREIDELREDLAE